MSEPVGQPKYKRIKDLIIENVRKKIFPNGSFLPSENELMRMFDAGRNTIRGALDSLTDEGIIVKGQGRRSQINIKGLNRRSEGGKIAWLDTRYVGFEGIYFEIFKHLNSAAENNGMSVDYVNLQFPHTAGNFLKNMSLYKGIVTSGHIMKGKIPGDIFEALGAADNVISVDNTQSNPARLITGADHHRGAFMAVEALAAAGRKKPVFLGISEGFYRYQPFTDRLSGFKDAVAFLPLCNDPGLIFISAEINDSYDARPALERILKKHPDADSFFAITDFMAVQTLYALKGLGINVPFDMSVIGFDGLAIGESVSPRLTTIAQPVAEIAEKVVKHIAEESFPSEKTVTLISPALISRESV